MYKFVLYEVNDRGIAYVTINRPDKKNALCQELMEELTDAFKKISADETVKAAILTGVEKTFVAGADIEIMSKLSGPGYFLYGGILNTLIKTIRENNKPVIAAVNGYAFGGGNVLALACDMIVAVEDAKFSQAEIHLGIFGGGALLPGLVGRYRAAEIILLGDSYTAMDAYRMGIVNRVVEEKDLMPTVTDMARKICNKSPLAIMLAKKSVLLGMNSNLLNAATDHNLALMGVMFGSQDQKEGMTSFLEKRKPTFTGK